MYVHSKEEISAPMDFKHIQHVGFDEDKGFSSFNVDKDLGEFFEKVRFYMYNTDFQMSVLINLDIVNA